MLTWFISFISWASVRLMRWHQPSCHWLRGMWLAGQGRVLECRVRGAAIEGHEVRVIHTHVPPFPPDHTQGPLCCCQSINDSNTWRLPLVFSSAPVTHWHGKYTQTTVLPCWWTHHYCSPGVKPNKILFNPRGPRSSLEIHHPCTSSERFSPNAPKCRYKFSRGEKGVRRRKKNVQIVLLDCLKRSHTSVSTKNPGYVCDIYSRSICVHRNSMTGQPFDGPDGKAGSAENTKHTRSLTVSHKHTHMLPNRIHKHVNIERCLLMLNWFQRDLSNWGGCITLTKMKHAVFCVTMWTSVKSLLIIPN